MEQSGAEGGMEPNGGRESSQKMEAGMGESMCIGLHISA